MTGDFTRDTFRPAKGYSAVRMQQGRLFTDADWNEQGSIQRHALRTTARSVIGPSGVPEDNPGFAIQPAAGGQTLLIGGGEAYVDGIRLVYPSPDRLTLKRASGAGAATNWQTDAGTRVAVGDHLALAGAAPATAVRVTTLQADVAGRQRFQCGAVLSANNDIAVDRYRSIESQPFLPASTLPAAAGQYLVYLDVWEREIGAIEDPAIREVAFGGPDTANRDQVIWQVRIAALADLVAAGALALPASCNSFGPGWTPFGPAARGRMGAHAVATAAVVDPCALPATGGYRSLENHLYRVEIHNGGAAGGTFKWSRDNGIHRTLYAEIDNGALIVDSLGRDDVSALKRDDWIEILDERRQLAGQPGFFARISDVNGTRVSLGEVRHPDTLAAITNNGAPDITVLPAKGLVRRWEGGLPAAIAAGPWASLENGVQVRFVAGRFATGDHWEIPSRSISAAIEWPQDEATGDAAAIEPAGIVHHFTALALATRAADGSWAVSSDCRTIFAPLTALKSFLYLGGDGQEAMPDPLTPATRIALAATLRVGVVRGKTPVEGASIRFEITGGDGRLGAVADNLKIRTRQTLADGVAEIGWSVDAITQTQQVVAHLLNSAGNPTHLPITFTAALRRAAQVSFDPVNTPALAGEKTVQGAIEKLAGLQQIGCSTYIIVEGSDWVKVFDALKPGEDAAICFQRGSYATDKPVEIKGKGHVMVSGASGGTRIVAKRSETALHFEDCASVTLHDLDIAAPDQSDAIGPVAERLGTVTILGCPEVDVSDIALSCGGGAATARTCLTIRGSAERPLRSVRVLRNRLQVGLAQDGILIADCVNTLIADNEIEVTPGKASVSPSRLFEEPLWRQRLTAILVADPKPPPARDVGQKTIHAGGFVVAFNSAIPQEEWTTLSKADPPKPADTANAQAMVAYVGRLADGVITQPARSPTFSRSLQTLGQKIGDARLNALELDIKRSLIVSGGAVARPETPVTGGPGQVVVSAGSVALVFGSPVNQADWDSAMKLIPAPAGASEKDLAIHLRTVAVRMIADKRLRDRLGSLTNWYDRFASALPNYARQAITCGGASLGEVAIRGNRVEGFVQGIHIGTSARDDKTKQASNVSVADNILMLRKPGEDVYCPMGLFVGNAESVRIQRNLLGWAGQRTKSVYNHGIRVWGFIGRYLMISENRISTARVGICVRPAKPLEENLLPKLLWVAADNLVDDVTPANVIKCPSFMRKRDNRPI